MTLSNLIIIIIIIFININYIYWTYIDYWSLILKSSLKKDFTKWILCDKYVAKEYAKLNGFKVPKTFQLTKYPNNIMTILVLLNLQIYVILKEYI